LLTSPQQVGNKSVVVVMELGKRHDFCAPTSYGFVTNLLRESYGETDVMDFGL